jgi:hypothetical protein
MVNFRVAMPTRSMLVERTFSFPPNERLFTQASRFLFDDGLDNYFLLVGGSGQWSGERRRSARGN